MTYVPRDPVITPHTNSRGCLKVLHRDYGVGDHREKGTNGHRGHSVSQWIEDRPVGLRAKQ